MIYRELMTFDFVLIIATSRCIFSFALIEALQRVTYCAQIFVAHSANEHKIQPAKSSDDRCCLKRETITLFIMRAHVITRAITFVLMAVLLVTKRRRRGCCETIDLFINDLLSSMNIITDLV